MHSYYLFYPPLVLNLLDGSISLITLLSSGVAFQTAKASFIFGRLFFVLFCSVFHLSVFLGALLPSHLPAMSANALILPQLTKHIVNMQPYDDTPHIFSTTMNSTPIMNIKPYDNTPDVLSTTMNSTHLVAILNPRLWVVPSHQYVLTGVLESWIMVPSSHEKDTLSMCGQDLSAVGTYIVKWPYTQWLLTGSIVVKGVAWVHIPLHLWSCARCFPFPFPLKGACLHPMTQGGAPLAVFLLGRKAR